MSEQTERVTQQYQQGSAAAQDVFDALRQEPNSRQAQQLAGNVAEAVVVDQVGEKSAVFSELARYSTADVVIRLNTLRTQMRKQAISNLKRGQLISEKFLREESERRLRSHIQSLAERPLTRER